MLTHPCGKAASSVFANLLAKSSDNADFSVAERILWIQCIRILGLDMVNVKLVRRGVDWRRV